MEAEEKSIQKTFERKYLEFKRDGLTAYASYLSDQLKQSESKNHWEVYRKYTEAQIEQTSVKLNEIEERLMALGNSN